MINAHYKKINVFFLPCMHLKLLCGLPKPKYKTFITHNRGSLIKNTLQLFFSYTKLVYLKSATLELFVCCCCCCFIKAIPFVVLWQPSYHPSGCCTLVVVMERHPPPPHGCMVVKRFGCIYASFIHSSIYGYIHGIDNFNLESSLHITCMSLS